MTKTLDIVIAALGGLNNLRSPWAICFANMREFTSNFALRASITSLPGVSSFGIALPIALRCGHAPLSL